MGLKENNYKEIVSEIVNPDKGILKLTLNRPSCSNAISDLMIEELCAALELADKDRSIRVIILTGAGKNFCSGGDVKLMKKQTGMFAGTPVELSQNYRYGIQRIPKTIELIRTPIIAQVNGAAIGAGLDLACMCDIRICSQNAKFGETFVKIGLVPGDGGGFFLQRVIGYSKAMELSLTGRVIGAEEAMSLGLVSSIAAEVDLSEMVLNLATEISANAPVAVALTKQLVREGYNQDVLAHLDNSASFQSFAQRTEDHFEGVNSILNKTPAVFKGL